MSRSKNRRKKGGGDIKIPKKFMPLLVIGAGVLLIGGAAIIILSGGKAGGEPNLVVEQEVFDYGQVAFNTPIETVFVVHNDGDAPLKILGTPQVELKDGC